MPFGFITVQYMNNLRDHVVTIFNVLYCNDLNKTIRKLSFFFLDTLDLIDVKPFI